MFLKSDEIPSLPVQVIKEKAKCCRLRIFLLQNVHLVDINVFAKFYDIPLLPFQGIEKPKRHGWTD